MSKVLRCFALSLVFLVVWSSRVFAAQPVYTGAAVVVPSDATVFTRTAALWVGTAETSLTVVMAGEGHAQVVFTNVAAGTLLPIAIQQVKATGTTVSTGMIALR
jgi:hypothetical protein